MEDIQSINARGKHRKNKKEAQAEFVAPSPSVVGEASPAFRVPKPPAGHRFAFLLEDIKPIERTKQPVKMKYELPNMKQVPALRKFGRPLNVVSLSTTDLPTVAGDTSDQAATSAQAGKTDPPPDTPE
jgi:hypothetical protein